MIITIDGPAGSGKSVVSKALAKELNIYYLYTGLLYRVVAYLLINKFRKKVFELNKITEKDLDFISKISYEYIADDPQIFYENENITQNLYNSSLDQPASIVSAQKDVRDRLLDLQRDIAKKYDIIADGRDCGSVVFSKADYKFYLVASLDERAKRIYSDEKRNNGLDLTLQKVKEELEVRDKRDRERDIAPLIIPNNAIVIDNSNLSQEDTIKEFLRFIKIK